MATNLKIDEQLLDDALKLGGFKTKKEAVNKALESFVQQMRQVQILELEGQIDYFEDYDHKKARRA
jgi:Arc/MetJ family transcription regulator